MRVRRLLRSPPLWGIAAGALVNATGLRLPPAAYEILSTVGGATGVLLSLGIGLLLSPTREGLSRAAAVVTVRVGTGLVSVLAIVHLFGLQGMDQTTLLLLGVAPVARDLRLAGGTRRAPRQCCAVVVLARQRRLVSRRRGRRELTAIRCSQPASSLPSTVASAVATAAVPGRRVVLWAAMRTGAFTAP